MTKLNTKKQQIAVITGASTGIGKAITINLLKKGYFVIMLSRKSKHLNELTAELKQKALTNYRVIPTDLSNMYSVINATLTIAKQFKHIDLFVHAASQYHNRTKAFTNIALANYQPTEVIDTLNITLTTPMLLVQGLIPGMNQNSKIIFISGTFEDGAKGWLPYYVAKKGLEDLTVGLSQELADKGIKVNCISPSDTLTDSYKKFFPEYAKPNTCLSTEDINRWVDILVNPQTGNIINKQIIELKK